MENHSVIVLVVTLVVILAAGGWSVSDEPLFITLSSNGTEPYRETPFIAYIKDVVDVDCEDQPKISLFSVTKEDYESCTLPVSLLDDGTSILIGDCPRVIKLVLAANIVSNSVNYKVGETFYYAAYGVNYLYQVENTIPCEEGVKFKLFIDEKKDKEPLVSPSSTAVMAASETSMTMDTSVLVATPITTPTSEVTTVTSESTEPTTDTSTETTPTTSKPSVESGSVIADGVFDSAVSQHGSLSLLTLLCMLVAVLTNINRLL